MSTETLPQVQEDRTLTAVQIRAQVNLIQEVMKAVMQKDVHYGTIPGTPKPTLYKPGAEKLLVTFRIAAGEPKIEDLSTSDCIRYRVTRPAMSIMTGAFLGAGVGECSSDEEKYKWRKPVCNEEFEETPEDKRREVWKKLDGKAVKIKQIRTRPADVANTVLKMADKRSYVAMTLQVTAAGDIFTQDIEDLPEGMDLGEEKKPAAAGPQEKPAETRATAKLDPAAQKAVDQAAQGSAVVFVPAASSAKPTKKEGMTRYAIKSPSDVWYSTFDDDLGKVAISARENKQKIKVTFENDGTFNTIVSIDPA